MLRRKSQSGFTLIELMITLSIIVILLFSAIPIAKEFFADKKAEAYVAQLTRAIAIARSEAIRRGESVIFCKSKDKKTCGGEWQDGQILLDQSLALLQVFDGVPPGAGLTWQSSFGRNDSLTLLPTGFTHGQKGSFYYCPASGKGRRIIVQSTGRVRTEKSTCN